MENYPKEYTKKYWKEVYQQAVSDLRSELGIKGDTVKLGWNIGLGSFLLFLFVAFIGSSLADRILGLQEKSNLNIVFYIIGTLFFADILGLILNNYAGIPLTAYFHTRYKVAAQRDYDKEKKLEDLTKKTFDANVEIKLFPRQSEGYASIKIVNNEDEDIVNYAVYLLGVWGVDKDGNELPITEKVNPDNALISRGGGNATGGEIRRRSEATFNVALHNDKSFYFLFDNGSRRESEQGLYKLKIGFDGNLGDKFINRISMEGYLEYIRVIGDVPDIKYPGDNLKRVVVGTFIDIRDSKEPTNIIQPSTVEDATGNEFWRYVVSHPTSAPNKKEEPQEGDGKKLGT